MRGWRGLDITIAVVAIVIVVVVNVVAYGASSIFTRESMMVVYLMMCF